MATDQFKSVFLADDDPDDCFLFEEALKNISISTRLITVHDGVELMSLLHNAAQLPHVIFLDLNMPRKNGFQCLEEIKGSDSLKQIDVIILSTAFTQAIDDRLLASGAKRCARKPVDLGLLQRLIHDSLQETEQGVVSVVF